MKFYLKKKTQEFKRLGTKTWGIFIEKIIKKPGTRGEILFRDTFWISSGLFLVFTWIDLRGHILLIKPYFLLAIPLIHYLVAVGPKNIISDIELGLAKMEGKDPSRIVFLKNSFIFLLIFVSIFSDIQNIFLKNVLFSTTIIACMTVMIKNRKLIEFFEKKQELKNTYSIKQGKIKILIYAIIIFSVSIKIMMPLVYEGSYIDEYNHIFSGIEFFENGEFYKKLQGESYTRGSHVSVLVGALLFLFGKNLFVAKLFPILLGTLNTLLVYHICKKIFLPKFSTMLMLLIYTTIPWFIFNHFYIRIYVFYEFCFIFILVLFLSSLKRLRDNQSTTFITSIMILVISVLYFFSKDAGKNFVILPSISLTAYVFLMQKRKRCLLNFYRIFLKKKILILLLIVLFIPPVFIYLDVFSLIQSLLYGTFKYTSGNDFKYNNLFLNLNPFFFILFSSSFVLLFFKIRKEILILILTAISLFTIHYNLSLDLQMTRVIIYFLPLFYLISIISLTYLLLIYNKKTYTFIFLVLALFNIYKNYPATFLEEPAIPTEITYTEYSKISNSLKIHCEETKNIAFLENPFVLSFYNIDIDYSVYLNSDLLEKDRRFFLDSDGIYKTVYKKIPTIMNLEKLKSSLSEGFCITLSEKDYLSTFDATEREALEKIRTKESFGKSAPILVLYEVN